MRRTAGLLSLVTLVCLPLASADVESVRSDSKIRYRAHSPAAFEAARRSGKPVFMVISAEWCGPCRQFHERTLETEQVAAYLNANFINVFVDADREEELAEKYQRGLPTTVLFDSAGRVEVSFGGVLTAEDLLSVLESVVASVRGSDACQQPPAQGRNVRRTTVRRPLDGVGGRRYKEALSQFCVPGLGAASIESCMAPQEASGRSADAPKSTFDWSEALHTGASRFTRRHDEF